MDAVKYLKERNRMCDSYTNMCDGCGFGKVPKCNRTEEDNPEKAVDIVERWSAEHPIKTRQSEFLKMFPDARINSDGVIDIDPCCLNEKLKHECDNKYDSCDDCHKDYWLSEVK